MAKEITAPCLAFFWKREKTAILCAHLPAVLSDHDHTWQRGVARHLISLTLERSLFFLPFILNALVVPQGFLVLKTNSFQSESIFDLFFVSLTFHLLTGILPTTVLGQVQSPDLDDWSEKVYQFEGKTSRYFDLIWWRLLAGWKVTCTKCYGGG